MPRRFRSTVSWSFQVTCAKLTAYGKKGTTYTLEIEHRDGGYLAYFPALPGCHTWGKTYEQAVNHAEEALIGFLEALQKNGEDIPVERPSAAVSLGLVVELPTAV